MNNQEFDLLLFQKRIIILEGTIEDKNASFVIAKLLAFNNPPLDDVYMFINSTGGQPSSCFAVYDTMKCCKYKIHTVCLKTTAAFATLLLAAGSKGMRYAFSDAIILPSLYPSIDNNEALYSDKASIINRFFDKVLNVYAGLTNNSIETMRSVCMTTHSLKPNDALKYGYIDNVIDLGALGTHTQLDYFEIVDLIQKMRNI